MGRNTHNISRPDFLVEKQNAARDPGRQVDFDAFGASYENEYGNVELKAGTVVSLDSNGKIIPRDSSGGDTAEGLLASSVNEGSDIEALSGYGFILGGHVYEDMLILDGGTLSTIKGELENASDYGWIFSTYSDDRNT